MNIYRSVCVKAIRTKEALHQPGPEIFIVYVLIFRARVPRNSFPSKIRRNILVPPGIDSRRAVIDLRRAIVMADPLSIAGSVAGLVFSRTYKYV